MEYSSTTVKRKAKPKSGSRFVVKRKEFNTKTLYGAPAKITVAYALYKDHHIFYIEGYNVSNKEFVGMIAECGIPINKDSDLDLNTCYILHKGIVVESLHLSREENQFCCGIAELGSLTIEEGFNEEDVVQKACLLLLKEQISICTEGIITATTMPLKEVEKHDDSMYEGIEHFDAVMPEAGFELTKQFYNPKTKRNINLWTKVLKPAKDEKATKRTATKRTIN